ncbi:flagellar export chaperone FliS [Neobacillus vireti]|uniref:Flagellar secretion chaperone FliS n=1 Tax=Neobacillus vireti LMG 21834 TaxID=1131730 RepID=A0AB94IQS3_9BACI|nr:flagellar export chaperone FliS [Neobacillus vireti]ETI69353.1 flagellar protein [Neobacillus vireti LMG 21834]KLT19822.1 flagellar biosynthesis protein FliS [Neobacillus vireti]
MAFRNPYQTYQKQAVTTSKPEDLTYMLYQGMVKFIRLAKVALQNNNLEESNGYNLRAQDILSELMVTLKPGYTISDPLLSLYDYMKSRLIEANISKKIEILEEVEGHAMELTETWSSAMKLNNTKN